MRSFSKMLTSIIAASAAVGLSVAVPAHADTPVITWENCPKSAVRPGLSCGRIDVPRDYSNPHGEKISIGFVQHTATKTAKDVVFVNPGGPGSDVYDFLGDTEVMEFPEEFLQNFTIIGVQPRGMHGSTPLTCTDDQKADVLQTITNSGGQLRAACERTNPGYFPHITTENTARDWEEVRKALKKDTISIYGVSYGTLLGSTYATLFPERTNKVLLDSGLDHTKKWTDSSKQQETGFIRVLHDFFEWAAAHDDTFHLGATPYAVYTTWAETIQRQSGVWPSVMPPRATEADLPPHLKGLGQPAVDAMNNTARAQAESKSVGTAAAAGGSSQKLSSVLVMTHLSLQIPKYWKNIIGYIQSPELADQDLGKRKAQLTDESEKDAIAAASVVNRTIMCNEAVQPWDRNLALRAVWANWILQDQFSGAPVASAWGYTCNGAPPITHGVPLDGSKLKTRPLQIQGTSDPRTALENSQELRSSMNAHLITVHGPGHGHFGAGNKQVDRVALDYLYTGNVTVTDVPGYFQQ
ncbi:MAG: alpha/beta fold hydrolase [Corynebacterium sp.]|uniref:alpha/beta fold hydrolase n=1 Tax=Corynebacterium sp. TaxID=1720 RepID=UPI0026DC9511|nr:alpha/beta fold hydrolase [Corynebacterium sp.]MDO5098416.1 alpha/beta fold hydrolase [Corynebacterium sp.]